MNNRFKIISALLLVINIGIFSTNVLANPQVNMKKFNAILDKIENSSKDQATKEKLKQALHAKYSVEHNSDNKPLKTATLNPLINAKSQADKKKKELAFDLMVDELYPLSNDQVIELKKVYDSALRAAATPANTPPTPITSTIKVDLAPGSTHPVIRLAKGFVSSLVFVDATGMPWPIASYSLGDPEHFDIQWDQASNALFVQSKRDYTHGNIAIRLKDLNTPLMLSFVSGQKQIDYRADLRVGGRGPYASAPIIEDSLTANKENRVLMNLLDGIPPAGSKKLGINPEFGQAWLKNGKLYFRSQLTLLSPAWITTISSIDGTKVYEMQPAPQLLASKDGNTFSVGIRGL